MRRIARPLGIFCAFWGAFVSELVVICCSFFGLRAGIFIVNLRVYALFGGFLLGNLICVFLPAPPHDPRVSVAALRIYMMVEALTKFLTSLKKLVAVDGRIVIASYHPWVDGVAKNFIDRTTLMVTEPKLYPKLPRRDGPMPYEVRHSLLWHLPHEGLWRDVLSNVNNVKLHSLQQVSTILHNPHHAVGPGGVTSVRPLLGTANAQTASAATSTAPAHQPLGSANAETTPAGAPAAAADTTQQPDATCEGKNG